MLFVSALVNLLGLASSLWLGFYILTRSPRSRISWLTALSLWSLSSYFFANSLAAYQPESGALLWPRFLVLFALPAWLHLTLELIAIGTPPARRTAGVVLTRAGIALSYATALFLVLLGIFSPALILGLPTSPRIYTRDPGIGPFYPLIPLFLFANITLSLLVLDRGRRAAFTVSLKRQFTHFLIATGLAGTGGVYVAIGTLMELNLPAFIGDATMGAGLTLLGYVVAKYNALIEGRRVERDFLYAMLAVGSLTLFYVLVTLLFYIRGQISFLALILTILGALSFNALYDGIRVALDRLFYRGQFVQLRQNLRTFAREIGTGQRLDDQLQAVLKSFCHALRIRKGFIALSDGTDFVVRATLEASARGEKFPIPLLTATEIVGLVRPDRKRLEGMTLLVPLFGGGAQIGAMVLGEKETGKPYSESEMNLLDDFVEQAGVIYALRAQEESIEKINALIADYRERERSLQLQLEQVRAESAVRSAPTMDEQEMAKHVEDALRHLHDFDYLGEHALSGLRVVREGMKQSGASTSIDRGKAVSEVLEHAIEKIRPNRPEPSAREIPAREWHPYLILRDSYVKDESNRNVMARLYVGEGTFNRTRRRALQTIARTLQEMERAAIRQDSRPTGTVTFLFTDIEASTKLWQEHRDEMKLALARHDVLMRQAIEAHKGFVFKTVGDQFCAAFPTAQDALAAAVAAQQAVTQEPWDQVQIKVRMALHTNSAHERDGDYFGPPLNRVARLLAAGHGGQILLSLATQELVQDHLPSKIELRDLGQHRLKDIIRTEHVYQVVAPDLPSHFPAIKTIE